MSVSSQRGKFPQFLSLSPKKSGRCLFSCAALQIISKMKRQQQKRHPPGRLFFKCPSPAKNYPNGPTESYHAGSFYPFGSFLRRRRRPPPPKPQRSPPPPPPSSINCWRRCDDDDIQSLRAIDFLRRVSLIVDEFPNCLRVEFWKVMTVFQSGRLCNSNQSRERRQQYNWQQWVTEPTPNIASMPKERARLAFACFDSVLLTP